MRTRFLCENCGKDVPYNAEVCSFCGRIFSAVKCPVCKRTGRPEIFKNGCPSCGYLSPKMDNLEDEETIKKVRTSKKYIKKKRKNESIHILLSILLITVISVLIILIIKGNL